jgi:hypothetical protein
LFRLRVTLAGANFLGALASELADAPYIDYKKESDLDMHIQKHQSFGFITS